MGFKILWIWNVGLIFTNEWEWDKIFSKAKTSNGFIICYKRFGFGLAHAFNGDIRAFKRD